MPEPVQRSHGLLSVWPLSAAAALSAIVISLLSWLMWPMYPVEIDYAHHATYFVVHRFGGLYHIGATLIFAFAAGIGAAILALLYNAMIRKHQRPN
jgi:hypothetical protein